MPWTKPQQAAIDKRNADILVSAAAGSGKTAVLTERVIQRIMGKNQEDPIQIDRFLIVTFTSAAANEMKERITNKLSEQMMLLQEQELCEAERIAAAEKTAYLQKQIALIQTASISTIHSFCLKVIKTYFHKLNIDPNIKVAAEAELMIMKMDILQEIIEQKFEEEDEDFLKVAEGYGSVHGMTALAGLILDIHTFIKSTPFPEVWLDEKVDMLLRPYDELEAMPWSKAIKGYILSELRDLEVLYQEAKALCKRPNGPELYSSVLEDDLQQLAPLLNKEVLDEMIQGIQKMQFANLPRKKQECDEGLKERVKAYRNLAKDTIKGLQDDLIFLNDEKVVSQLPKAGMLMQSLSRLIKEFEFKYQEAKQSAGIVDYSDLEHLCMKVLIEPQYDENGRFMGIRYTDAARELSHFYKEVYIDEYQDSNTVQEMILSAVAQAGMQEVPTRFMVGDMKQSIYRFRLANPSIFAEKYETWPKEQSVSSESEQVCIDLSQNFRSRSNLLDGINEIFEQIMSKSVGELTYDEYAALKVGNEYQADGAESISPRDIADGIELHILETTGKIGEEEMNEEGGKDIEDLKSAELEAMMSAELIHRLLKGEANPTHLLDNETKIYRKIEPRDIVILLRSTKSKASVYENALLAKGISAYADVSSSFFDALEIQTILSLIKIIDNPLQDIPLLTVLRSPIVGASYDDLVRIRKGMEKGPYYEALKAYCEQEDAKDNIKHFMDQLYTYRELSNQLTIEELIAKVYVETGYYRYVMMLPTGMKKKANLELLKKYAGEFERNQTGGLFCFIQYLDKLRENSDSLGEAKLVGDNENLVRIMSIHKSKGLEFGIVFLCDTAKKFNHSDSIKNVLLHSDLGLAPDFLDTTHHVRYPTFPKIAVRNQVIMENISEEMRVLYVALTRAKEKLFITGTVADFTQKAKSWSLFAVRNKKEILPLGVKKAGSYLNWIGMSLFAHPDGSAIREAAEADLNYRLEGRSKWALVLWNKADLVAHSFSAAKPRIDQKGLFDSWDVHGTYSPHKKDIYERLSFKYPHHRAVNLPTKLSVSEINDKDQQGIELSLSEKPSDPQRIPDFMNDDSHLQGARRGTLIHSVFEHLDFSTYRTQEAITEKIGCLVYENIIQEEVLKVIDVNRLVQVANSEMAERMRKAKYVWKEKQFVYLAEADTINQEYPEDEHILIQGVIDTLFIEEDGIVIIDYKSDYIAGDEVESDINRIKEKYKRQLEIYGQAIGQITGMPIKEKYIYLYHINKWICL